MDDTEPIVLELDSATMWTLNDDARMLSLNVMIPAVAGLNEPLSVSIEFDRESIDEMTERLVTLRAKMLP
jgi:hypothetical protein